MAPTSEGRAAQPGIYIVVGNKDGYFHLFEKDGNAQYVDSGTSVQSILQYADEWSMQGLPCSIYAEINSPDLPNYVARFAWLFTAPLPNGQSAVGYVFLDDVKTNPKPPIYDFGNANYAPLDPVPDVRGLKKVLKKHLAKT